MLRLAGYKVRMLADRKLSDRPLFDQAHLDRYTGGDEALTAERTAPEAHVTGRLVPAQLFFDDPAADAVEGEPGLVLMMTPLQGLPAGGAERRKTPR